MSFKPVFIFMLSCLLLKVSGQALSGDSARQQHYNQLGNLFLGKSRENKSNLDSAYYYFRKAIYLADSANPNNNLVTNESLRLLAATYFQNAHFAEGKKIFLQVIKSYQRTRNKKKEADAWYQQGRILFTMDVEFDVIDTSFKEASRLYFESGHILNKIDTDYDLAFFHFRMGREALASKELLNTIKLSREKGGYKLTDLLFLIATLKRYGGALNEALTYTMEVQKRVQQTNDTLNTQNVYGELALEYEEMNEPEKAIYWYKQCIDERLKLHFDGYIIYRTAYLMTVQMIKAKKEREGLLFLQNLNRTHPPANAVENAILYQSLAYCYNSMGEYANAEKYFLTMINMFDGINENNEVLFIANLDVGKFYVTRQQFARAAPYLKKAFSYIAAPSVSRIMDLHLQMFKVDSATGQYASAIDHFQKYKALNDSLFNTAKSKQIEELNIKYDVEKKQQNLTILQKENIVQQKNLKQAKLTRNFILAGAVMLVLIVGLLFNRYQLKQQANRKLEASQDKVEKQNLSLHRLVNEKEWLLKEIHHRVKNNLHTINGLLNVQSGYLQTEEALIAISDSQHRVQAMSLLHQKLFHSESLSTVKMPEYILELVGYLEHSFGTQQRVRFNLDVDSLQLNLSHALPIGLILNEAITNAIKYAFPGEQEGAITIRLKRQSFNQCFLCIADTGKGLPTNFDAQQSDSMGMNLMNGLSEDINGSFSIKSNHGTEIKISFSYDFSAGNDFSFHENPPSS